MAEATTTNGHRRRMALHHLDGASLLQVTHIAFGSGGHNSDGTPKEADPESSALQVELLRKPLTEQYQEDDFSVTCVCRIEKGELTGVPITEIGLLDASGNLVGFKNTSIKILDADEDYEPRIKLRF